MRELEAVGCAVGTVGVPVVGTPVVGLGEGLAEVGEEEGAYNKIE
jgi:hypothetical protein